MAEDWPLYRALIWRFGKERTRLFILLRDTLGVSPVEAKALLASPEVEIARDPNLEKVRDVAARFRAAGARVKVEITGSPRRVSAAEALQLQVGYPGGKPLEIEGYLLVTGLFGYLAAEPDAPRGIPLRVDGPAFARKITRKAEPRVGGSVLLAGHAVVAGYLHAFYLPMFPLALDPLVLTYYPEAFDDQEAPTPVRMKFF